MFKSRLSIVLLGAAIIIAVCMSNYYFWKTVTNHEVQEARTNDSLQIIVIEKNYNIERYKVEMNDEIHKAINANDSDAVKQFIELCTK